ncbi:MULTISPECIES: winged helix-turn-helix transcriptional regulator [Acetobacter]|uniref:Uncharacterized protein n=1 Tax=Acetobacter pasteurianus subsp. pasteurianus TaxID=481145 RepID=A0A1Y0Y256_ACEPA|nr:winged helix-turn-helix transcriptional regulator [Acetobacter pasteurianus]ARW49279.1 hypothetical protein S1001342_02989 [Acetobacter pasteurianus subsp. pasteurianus]
MHKRREAGVMERVEWLNSSNNKIAQALSTWPNGHKLTQQALADATGLSIRTIRSHSKNLLNKESCIAQP